MSRRKRFTRNLGRDLPSPLERRTTVEWVRFEHEHEPFGVFSYLKEAEQLLPAAHCSEIVSLRSWFNEHLDAPEVLTEERFWFCAEAEIYIAQAKRLAELVCLAGVPIVERRTRRVPGSVTWYDKHQVAVLTYRDTPGKVR